MTEIRELTAAAARQAIAAGEISGEECAAAWHTAAGEDAINAYLWRPDEAPAGDVRLAPVAV